MVIGTTALTVLPLSYILLIYNFSILYVLYLLVFIEIITGIMKIWFFSEILSVKKLWYIKNVIIKMFFPFIITNILLYITINLFIPNKNTFLIIILSFIIYIPMCYLLSLNKQEKKKSAQFC